MFGVLNLITAEFLSKINCKHPFTVIIMMILVANEQLWEKQEKQCCCKSRFLQILFTALSLYLSLSLSLRIRIFIFLSSVWIEYAVLCMRECCYTSCPDSKTGKKALKAIKDIETDRYMHRTRERESSLPQSNDFGKTYASKQV